MHSMHQVQAMHNGTLGQQHHQPQHLGASAGPEPKPQLNMTVLETLEPAQPAATQQAAQQQAVLGSLDPVQQTMIQQQQTVIHHLVPTPAPLLHQLQPSSRQLIEQQQQQQQLELEQQQHQQQHPHQPARDESASQQQQQQQAAHNQRASRGQIDGIASDSGGPIVQWLLENYEIADGESLPRSTVYNHYLAHCRQLRLSSVNAASFGKLIRSVFLGLKTRRLGTRGHSKYHYFGVRAKHHVRFDWLHEAAEGGAGCSSAMLRDSNDTNSNGSDGNCGSESDSTGNCSGRLSTSISGAQSSGNGGLHAKRIKRSSSNGPVHDDYQRVHPGPLEHAGNLEDLDQRHQQPQHQQAAHLLSQQQQQQQQQHHHHHLHHNLQQESQQSHHQQLYEDHSAPNGGMYLAQAYPVNGYDKQQDGSFVGDARWPAPDQFDLSSFRNHLGPNKATLVCEHWPAREPGRLERQLEAELAKQASSKSRDSADQTGLTGAELACLVEPFESQYKFYFKRMVDLLGELQFHEVEHLWSEFWHPPARQDAPTHWTREQAPEQTMAYQSEPHHHHHQQQQQQHFHAGFDNLLTSEQLYELTSQRAVVERIAQIDCKLYTAIESFLVVDMLSPLPRPLVQHLRAFARNICLWTEAAVKGYHPGFVAEKVRSARAFEHALRRHTSINHLSTASRAIWNKRSALAQMSADLSRLDLQDIEHQVASLMSQEKLAAAGQMDTEGHTCCRSDALGARRGSQQSSGDLQPVQSRRGAGSGGSPHELMAAQQEASEPLAEQSSTVSNIQNANDNIENNYTSHNSASGADAHRPDSGSNLNGCGLQTGGNTFGAPAAQFDAMQPAQLVQNFLHLLEDPYPANAWPDWCRALVDSRVGGQSFDEARNFILKWNFYISLILRELTLRSAPSLGSLQLIRLLFDEYMYHLVVSKLAQAEDKTSEQLLRNSAKFV